MRLLLIVLFSLPLIFVKAQNRKEKGPEAFSMGVVEHLKSEVLGQVRTLNIYLPQGYSPDSIQGYPVVYLLDGSADEDFVHVSGIVQFMNMLGMMPPTIVVGIGNVDRQHDFTHVATFLEDKEYIPTSGGSAEFMEFMRTELIPYVESHYKVGGGRTLIGQSLGGLLATEIMLRDPAMFDTYIIVSPSLWWDARSLLKQAPILLNNHASNVPRVYVAAGSEGDEMKKDVDDFVDALKSSGKVNLIYAPFPEEDHLTILHRAVYRAFELMFVTYKK